MGRSRILLCVMCLIGCAALAAGPACDRVQQEKVGVLYILHGGMDEYKPQNLWDSSVHQFAYDPNHAVYQFVIWEPDLWPTVLTTEFAVKFIRKFEFEYERIGGVDPFHALSDTQLADMQAELNNNSDGIVFEVDFASWMSGDRPEHFPYPRFLYYGPAGNENKCTYCGEGDPDGPWPGCDPERFNIDGPVERLLAKGVTRIIAVDLTVGGVRFYKSYEVVQMAKRALAAWNEANGKDVPLLWVNDYSSLMERSYPTAPEGWTPFQGPPEQDSHVLLQGSPNPVAADPDLALLGVEGIEDALSVSVADADTGVFLFNHGLFDADRAYFDPKIDDTLILNDNIEALLLERRPDIDPDNIIGGFGGVRELNPDNGLVERTRTMRGEDLAHSQLYQTEPDLPEGKWGYRYWDALEYLKNRGVQHIVVAFPQVVTDSVLTLVEFENQVGKEIGIKTWLQYSTGNDELYPGVGHPFADYWGNWVDTDCGGAECCFEMGGCADGRPYPPPRQTALDKKREDMDPSLAYDLSDYGHLGYDPAAGPPDPDGPVQDQYTGTWEVYTTPSDDPRVGKLLAKHVLAAAVNPLVFITNGEIESAAAGEAVTWQATVVSGTAPYSYRWEIQRDGGAWTAVGEDAAAWTGATTADDAGSYAVRCTVTDARDHVSDVTWNGFVVTE